MSLTQKITLEDLGASLNTMAMRSTSILPVMQAGQIMAVADVKQRFFDSKDFQGGAWPALKFPRPGSKGADKPLLDKGLLAASFSGRADERSLTVGTAAVQAPLMNFGGTVTPKHGKFLTIPLTIEARRAGSPRFFTRALRPIISKGGAGGVLVDRASGVAQFAMTKSVTVPPRRFMGWSEWWLVRFKGMLASYVTTGRL